LEILLTDKAAKLFNGNVGYRGEFELEPSAFVDLRDALRIVFRDCDCYRELA
jgi:hypothetical protein